MCSSPSRSIDWYTETTGTQRHMTECKEGGGEEVILLWTGLSLGKGEVSILVIAPCYAKRIGFPAIVC